MLRGLSDLHRIRGDRSVAPDGVRDARETQTTNDPVAAWLSRASGAVLTAYGVAAKVIHLCESR